MKARPARSHTAFRGARRAHVSGRRRRSLSSLNCMISYQMLCSILHSASKMPENNSGRTTAWGVQRNGVRQRRSGCCCCSFLCLTLFLCTLILFQDPRRSRASGAQSASSSARDDACRKRTGPSLPRSARGGLRERKVRRGASLGMTIRGATGTTRLSREAGATCTPSPTRFGERVGEECEPG